MGWPETHRYYGALRELEHKLDRILDHRGDHHGDLPWRPEYATIFGDRRGLLLALWRRWEIMVQAQVGPDGGVTLAQLAIAHPGLVLVLRAHADELAPLRFTDPISEFAWGGAA